MVRLDMGQNKSLGKALAVLETLTASPVSAARLGQQLKFPRPALYRIFDALRLHDFVAREEGGASYRLSFKVPDLGHRRLEQIDLLGAASGVSTHSGDRHGRERTRRRRAPIGGLTGRAPAPAGRV